jgi:hypothetical protein
METLEKALRSLGEYTAKFFYDRNSDRDIGGINCISDDRPGFLGQAEVILNQTCIEKAEILNGKLILYARDPMVLISHLYYKDTIWNYIQQKILEEYDLTLAIAKFDNDWTAPIEPIPYTLNAWEYIGPHLRDICKSFGKAEYRDNVIRIFGE